MAVQQYKLNENSKVTNIIAVMSGKGGVGKSFVSQTLATHLNKRGFNVGILDADITGPSIPKAFGINDSAFSDGKNIIPKESEAGIKMMSVNLILEDPTQPVLWRAPVVGNAIKQFFENVNWGNLDYLLIDMPPGTGDVSLTVFQSLPIDGVVIVSTPQDLVQMIVEKAVNMANMLNIKIMGLVENMSYFKCPNCDEITEIFGDSKVEAEAKKHNIKNTLRIPIDPDFTKKVDAGKVEEIEIKEYNDFIDYLI